jgi:hypothetical protein
LLYEVGAKAWPLPLPQKERAKMKSLFLLTALLFCVASKYDSCGYQLDQAVVIDKIEDGIMVKWKGEDEKVECQTNSQYEAISIGDVIYVVTTDYGDLKAVATYDDLVSLPECEDEVIGPVYRRDEDGNCHRVMSEEEVAARKEEVPHVQEIEKVKDDLTQYVEELWQEETSQ